MGQGTYRILWMTGIPIPWKTAVFWLTPPIQNSGSSYDPSNALFDCRRVNINRTYYYYVLILLHFPWIYAPFMSWPFCNFLINLINPAVFHRKTFLSTQLISKKSHEQDVAIFIVLALIIVIMNQKKNHQFVCKSSDVVYVELYCAHGSLTIYDTGCPSGHVSCLRALSGCAPWICLHFSGTSVRHFWV